jgi:pepF/M3 family oligoendopeptidase
MLDVRTRGWIGTFADRIAALSADERLQSYRFFLQETARRSLHLMSEPLESLAADLVLDGAAAFEKLHGSVTSQLEIPFEHEGRTQLVPITVVRNHSFSPDRALRERAYHAEQTGWQSVRTPVAACLNGVKGTALTLAKRRGYTSVLQTALDDNHIDQATLDAMLDSIRVALPMFHRYLYAKARHLGLPKLAWWDLFAPVGAQTHTLSWDEAQQTIVENFGRFDTDMADFAITAFEKNWIDAPPRAGKRGGAFCMEVMGVDESRILMNFDGSFEQTSTLAHELGHGYHNHCQRGLPAVLRGSPMGLAETASIFCETLLAEGVLSQAAPSEQAAILETQLTNAMQVCVDILSRFEFESSVLNGRANCELTADEFCELMLTAQRNTYGDAVDPDTYHRYMWLWKPHYYSYQSNFYNFPYAFGLLFSLGLYAKFCEEGPAFVPRYQQLLRNTNCDLAAPLAAQFGIDITKRDFWQSSLDVVAKQLEQFEKLAPGEP